MTRLALLGADARRRIRRASGLLLAVVTTAVLFGLGAASAQDPGGRAGIEKAKAKEIKVDPAAEPMMAAAPAGTCANDPTLDTCPQATAVVKVELGPDGSYQLTPPATGGEARTAAPPGCTLRANGPYRAAGYAQGDATHECFESISRHELYGELYKHYKDAWHKMAVGADAANRRSKIEVHPRYSCTALPLRTWQFHANAFTLHGGTWYAAQDIWEASFYCG